MKNVNDFIDKENNPLKNMAQDGGFTSIFRTLGCIGDSLASGEHEYVKNGKTEYYDMYEYSWGQFIARKCGLKAYNFSVGGLTAKGFHNLAFIQKAYTKEKECQAYIIALGVNDMNHLNETYSRGFGSLADIDFDHPENNADSFAGWYVKIIQNIRAIPSANSKIFLVTMPTEKNNGELCDKHAEFVRSLPTVFKNVYVIDLRKYAFYNDEFENSLKLGGHLNAMGYKYTADVLAGYIDYIIRENPEDFKEVAFIGKEANL